MLEDLTTFRGSEPFSMVVYDADLERQGLFPFYFADVYRVFRWYEVYPLSSVKLDELLDSSKYPMAAAFRREVRERRKREDVVANAKVLWRSTPRPLVALSNVNLPQPAMSKGLLRFGSGWEISANLPTAGSKVREIACGAMRELAITYLIFEPATYRLPPLFKYYPLLDVPNLCVAFGHNAFLLHSCILRGFGE